MSPSHTSLDRTALLRHGQRGDTLLVTLLVLLVLFMGVVYTMRTTVVDAFTAGNTLARQKDTQISDLALRLAEATIYSSSSGMALELSGLNQPWYRVVAPGTSGPNSAYWSSCLGNNTTSLRCGSISLAVNGQTPPYLAYAVVQPTGYHDVYACAVQGQTAWYYDIYLYIAEAPGGATNSAYTNITTETVYKLCVTS